jgi:hypothetical protein
MLAVDEMPDRSIGIIHFRGSGHLTEKACRLFPRRRKVRRDRDKRPAEKGPAKLQVHEICSNVHCFGDLSGRQRKSLVPCLKRQSVTWS